MNPGTFTQMYIHLVFAPRRGHSFLHESIRDEVFKYISGIITELEHKSIIVNGMGDHVHVFLGLNPKLSVSDTVKEIKRASSRMINEQELLGQGHFEWQHGYGGFSVSRSNLDKVYHYIADQEEHHRKKSFQEEYVGLLKRHHIPFDERYLFEFDT